MWHEIHGRSDPGAPTVLLCSGLGGAAHYWAPNVSALAKDFRVIAYDQNGTGRSTGTLPPDYGIADMAAEVAGLLDELAVEKAHFIGHALGGLIGLQLAVDRPALIDRLVLVNAWAQDASAYAALLRRAQEPFIRDRRGGLRAGAAAVSLSSRIAGRPAGLARGTGRRRDRAVSADRHGSSPHPGDRGVRSDSGNSPHHRACAGRRREGRRAGALRLFDQPRRPVARGSAGAADHGGHACNITDPAGFDELVRGFLPPTVPK